MFPVGTLDDAGMPVVTEPFSVAPVVVTDVADPVVRVGARGLDAVSQLAPSFGEVSELACVIDSAAGVAEAMLLVPVAPISTRSKVVLSKKYPLPAEST